jgi:hypothetical protein
MLKKILELLIEKEPPKSKRKKNIYQQVPPNIHISHGDEPVQIYEPQ